MTNFNTVDTVDTASNTCETETRLTHYITISGHRVPISDELQKLYNKEINDARNRARREHSCACADYRICRGDCSLCSHHVRGMVISTDDDRYGDGYSTGVNRAVKQTRTPEDIVMAREALTDVMRAAAGIARNGDTIIMRMAEGISQRDIADELGMPRTTVQKYLNKILAYLNEHRSDFVDW